MAAFTFTSPEGKSYTVNGPDGATQEQAFQILQQQLGAQPPANQAKVASMVKDAQTPTGFEAAAVPIGAAISDTGRSIAHLAQMMAAGPGGYAAASAANAADQAQTDAQEQPARDAAAAANPHEYYGLYAPAMLLSQAPFGEGVGGAAAKGTAALSASSELLPKIAGFLARSSATGAGYGAQMPGDTLTNIEAGAALGPVAEATGNTLKLAGSIAKKTGGSASELVRQMANPVTEAQNTVGKIVRESATGSPVLQPSPVPGVELSAGGQSMDPGLQGLERVIRSRNVGGLGTEDVAQAIQRQNNAVIRGRFGQIAATDAPLTDSSTAAHDALTAAQDARGAQEKTLWQQVPEGTQVDAAKTSAAVDGFINKQSITNQRVIQRAAGDFLSDFKATVAKYAQEGEEDTQVKMPFGEVKDLRSTLGQSIRDASKAGNKNAVRLLKGIDEKLLSTLGDENALLGVPEPTGNAALDGANIKMAKMNGAVTAQDLGDAYNAARGFTADTHGKYFTRDVQGFLNQDPAKMLDQVTKTPENLKAYLNAAGQAPDGGTKAVQALRNYLMSKGVGNAGMSARGGTDEFINGQKLGDWLHENQTLLSHVFSGDELQNMQQGAEAAYRNIATEAATPRVGSNTLQKFMGNQNLPGMPGKIGAVANTLRDALVGKYRGQTEQMLRDTLMDPQNKGLQQILDQQPTPGNLVRLVKFMQSVKELRGKIPLVTGAFSRAPQVLLQRTQTQQSAQQ